MRDLIFKVKILVDFRRSVMLLLVVFFTSLCGCSSNNTVSSIPHEIEPEVLLPEENERPNPQHLRHAERAEALKRHFASWKGTRYRFGGLSRKGIDCSGFTLLTYKELFGQKLPRTVRQQVKKGIKVAKTSLQAGDLVFFKTGIFQKHVGIYLENDLFMHASISRGVMLSRLDNVYWQKHYWQAKRI